MPRTPIAATRSSACAIWEGVYTFATRGRAVERGGVGVAGEGGAVTTVAVGSRGDEGATAACRRCRCRLALRRRLRCRLGRDHRRGAGPSTCCRSVAHPAPKRLLREPQSPRRRGLSLGSGRSHRLRGWRVGRCSVSSGSGSRWIVRGRRSSTSCCHQHGPTLGLNALAGRQRLGTRHGRLPHRASREARGAGK